MTDKKVLLPLWIKMPHLSRYSIGWRMGDGEDYSSKFWEWFDCLSKNEQEEYKNLFPEPKTWHRFWEEMTEEESYGDKEEKNGEELYFFDEKTEFMIEFWEKDGVSKYDIKKITRDHNSGKKQKFLFFWGHQPSKDGILTKSVLSQWWKSDFYDIRGNHKYCCMEQFMMVKKAELFGDIETKKEIMESFDPKKIKALGRKVKNFDDKLWNKLKYSIVLNGNYLKFTQNKELKEFLLSTKDKIIVEASPLDKVWGIGMAETNKWVENPQKWKGENLLGFALMEVRDEIKRVYANEKLCE